MIVRIMDNVNKDHRKKAESLVAEMRSNDGLAPVDLERFWADQEIAAAEPFGEDIPQVPIGELTTSECVFDELGIEEDWYRHYHDREWLGSVSRAYNDRAESVIGRRLLSENPPDLDGGYPPIKQLHDIFEAPSVWQRESYWIEQSVTNLDELKALLDRVEKRLEDLKDFILPAGWDKERKRLMETGVKPPLYRHQRGPVTFATSIYGPESLIFLIYDHPEIAERFSRTILKAILERARIIDEEAGHTQEAAPRGFSFADDNCALLTPEMYELFGYPVLESVFERYAPDPEDRRFQHSDSAMAHLLPLLGRLKLNGTNFGPTVTVEQIRRDLPNAAIFGQLAPFTYSRNEEVKMVEEFLRDFEMARESRGLVFTTAGSVNNGSRLTGMRLIMAAVQKFGRYDS